MMTAVRPIRSRADLAGRGALVLGLARSGAAAARYLADAGARVTVYDRRPGAELADAVRSLEGREVRLALGVDAATAEHLIEAAGLLVTSPSISARFPTTDPWLREALARAEARGVALLSEVELFLRLTRARVLAVTGTKGKTTTTALLDAILAAAGLPHATGGNIGTPLIELADGLRADAWAVLELSELQLPTISRGADVAVYTNIGADHLDRHGSVAAYRAVKARLAELTAHRAGAIVLNAEDRGCRDLAAKLAGADLHWYAATDAALDAALDADADADPTSAAAAGGGATVRLEARVRDGVIELDGSPLLRVDELPLPGAHLRADVLAAALGAHLLGVEADQIAAAIRAFRGVPHRLETLGARDGVRWVNDSQATIPVAAIAALAAFAPSRVVLIAGGQGKGLDYGTFAEAIAARCRAAVLIGETADELAHLVGDEVPVHRVDSMPAAVAAAAELARPGDVVLLSPAATSFDMFASYAARGDAFREAAAAIGVMPLAAGGGER